jgi:hypothetical protein
MLHRGCYCLWYNLRFWNSVKFTIEFLLSSILCCYKVRSHAVDRIELISRSWDDLLMRCMRPTSIPLPTCRARCTSVTNLGVSVRFIFHSDNKESFCRSILCCTQDFLCLLWERSDALLFTWHTAGCTTTVAYRRYTVSDFFVSHQTTKFILLFLVVPFYVARQILSWCLGFFKMLVAYLPRCSPQALRWRLQW